MHGIVKITKECIGGFYRNGTKQSNSRFPPFPVRTNFDLQQEWPPAGRASEAAIYEAILSK
jgi:hypothetical protein